MRQSKVSRASTMAATCCSVVQKVMCIVTEQFHAGSASTVIPKPSLVMHLDACDMHLERYLS